MKDTSLLQGVAAIITSVIGAIAFLVTIFRGKPWINAFRTKLDLAAEREAMLSVIKQIKTENDAIARNASILEKTAEVLRVQNEADAHYLKRQLAIANGYIRDLLIHALALARRAQHSGVSIHDLPLPTVPVEITVDVDFIE